MSSESLGQRIKRARLDKGLTQREVAEAVSITVPYMSKIEGDRETPTDEKLERIANELSLDADELILAAGRLPEDVMERLTSDPAKALEFLRRVREVAVAKATFPRRNEVHKVVASEILHRYAAESGESVKLPIPIEMIVEKTFGLTIDWDDIDEPDGFVVLGALSPSHATIVMNTRHLDRFERWVGPERFTLAHELAHWIYDANPDQGTLDLGVAPDVFCRRDDTSQLDRTTQIREQNANKLAAHLLLPDELVSAADLVEVLADFRGTANAWGVSQQTLRIKLDGLGMLDDADLERLGPTFD